MHGHNDSFRQDFTVCVFLLLALIYPCRISVFPLFELIVFPPCSRAVPATGPKSHWQEKQMVLLDLAGCGRSSLAAHAGGVNCFRRDQIQVFVIRDLVQPVSVLEELNVQVLVDLLQKAKNLRIKARNNT